MELLESPTYWIQAAMAVIAPWAWTRSPPSSQKRIEGAVPGFILGLYALPTRSVLDHWWQEAGRGNRAAHFLQKGGDPGEAGAGDKRRRFHEQGIRFPAGAPGPKGTPFPGLSLVRARFVPPAA